MMFLLPVFLPGRFFHLFDIFHTARTEVCKLCSKNTVVRVCNSIKEVKTVSLLLPPHSFTKLEVYRYLRRCACQLLECEVLYSVEMLVPQNGGSFCAATATILSCFLRESWCVCVFSLACMLSRMVGSTFSGFLLVAFRLMCFAWLAKKSLLALCIG